MITAHSSWLLAFDIFSAFNFFVCMKNFTGESIISIRRYAATAVPHQLSVAKKPPPLASAAAATKPNSVSHDAAGAPSVVTRKRTEAAPASDLEDKQTKRKIFTAWSASPSTAAGAASPPPAAAPADLVEENQEKRKISQDAPTASSSCTSTAAGAAPPPPAAPVPNERPPPYENRMRVARASVKRYLQGPFRFGDDYLFRECAKLIQQKTSAIVAANWETMNGELQLRHVLPGGEILKGGKLGLYTRTEQFLAELAAQGGV